MDDLRIIYNKIYRADDHIATINFNRLYVKKDKLCNTSRIYINNICRKLKLDIEYV